MKRQRESGASFTPFFRLLADGYVYAGNDLMIEKDEDVCNGTSKANSAIAHAGFDAKPGTLKAKLNVEGNLMMEQLSKELDFPFKQTGAFVVCVR